MESILTSIKQMFGLGEDYTPFDPELIMHINSVFSILNDLGVGTTTTFKISDDKNTWADFLGASVDFEDTKSYMFMKVKLIFDPPASTALIEAYERQINEFQWRLMRRAEPAPTS